MVFPDGAGLDKFFADLAGAQTQNPGTVGIFDTLTVEKEHRDTLSLVTAYQHK